MWMCTIWAEWNAVTEKCVWSRFMMVLSQAVVKQTRLQPEIETFVTVVIFQTSCFETSHEQQHSARYPASCGSLETTYAAPPCDFNWMIRCNSISNRRAMRVSMRRKAKEQWWVEPLSMTLHHRCYLSGYITRPGRPRSAQLCGPLRSNCLGHQFQEPRSLQV